uniref:Uncharacterized protein n=1 Tax=Anguilla anguilla TaxID=7936 RepID=A0A0E9QMG6_ANGAN
MIEYLRVLVFGRLTSSRNRNESAKSCGVVLVGYCYY